MLFSNGGLNNFGLQFAATLGPCWQHCGQNGAMLLHRFLDEIDVLFFDWLPQLRSLESEEFISFGLDLPSLLFFSFGSGWCHKLPLRFSGSSTFPFTLGGRRSGGAATPATGRLAHAMGTRECNLG